MSLSPLRNRPAWTALEGHQRAIKGVHLRQLFAEDSRRGERLTVEGAGVFLDYSKNRINNETLSLLLELAHESGLRAVLQAARAAQTRSVEFAVCGMSAPVQKVFQMSGMHHVLTIHGELPC